MVDSALDAGRTLTVANGVHVVTTDGSLPLLVAGGTALTTVGNDAEIGSLIATGSVLVFRAALCSLCRPSSVLAALYVTMKIAIRFFGSTAETG